MRLLVACSLVTLLAAGCAAPEPTFEDSVTLTDSDVLPDDSSSATLRCSGQGRLEVDSDASENGTITVQLREGNGIPVFEQDFGPGATTFEEGVEGGFGLWQITVHRTLEFNAPFMVQLWC